MAQSRRRLDDLGDGRILIGSQDKGGGTAIFPRLVITAGHVIAGTQPGAPVFFKTQAERLVPAVERIGFVEGRDAAAIGLDDEVVWSPTRLAEDDQRWWVGATGLKNDPLLTGRITKVDHQIRDSAGNQVAVMQLHVDQNLGGFGGYSGSAVRNTDGEVTGILIEQLPQRLAIPRPPASNVLYALPITDVLSQLWEPIPVPSVGTLRSAQDADARGRSSETILLRESFAPIIEYYVRTYGHAWAAWGHVTDMLNHFIGRPGSGYLVITAPKGSCKTALIATLLSQRHSRVAYHLFSRWYGDDGLDELFFLQDIVQQLMWLQGRDDKIPESLMKLRAMYHNMMSQPASSPITVVLDGLDEVTEWQLWPYLIGPLPTNVRFIVTMQDAHESAVKYCIPPEETSFLRLDELKAEALARRPEAGEDRPGVDESRPAPEEKRPVQDKDRPGRTPLPFSQASLQAGQLLNALTDQLQAQVMQMAGAAALEQAQYRELQLESDANNAAARSVAEAAQHKMQTNRRIMEGFDQVLSG